MALKRKIVLPTLIIVVALVLFSAAKPVNPAFEDVAQRAGITETRVGGGGSWGYYDGDGLEDLVVPWGSVTLLKNNGDGTFADVTAESGLDKVCCSARTAVFADYDNDGDQDLYVVNFGSSRTINSVGEFDLLFRNNGDGTFTDITLEAGINCGGHGEGAAWADFNKDGFLDIYVANYGVFDGKEHRNEHNCLFQNNGNGTFTEVGRELGVTGVPLVNSPTRNYPDDPMPRRSLSFQPVWFDYNNDSWDDLFIATDQGASPLYRNNGDGTFTEVTEEAGLNKYGTGMGVAIGDYDQNGFLDIYVTNDGPNYLWRNNGDGTFTEVAAESGVADELGVGWGTEFFDFDNDGDSDLFVTNGVTDLPGMTERESELEIRLGSKDALFRNNGNGTFTNFTKSSDINDFVTKRGAAFADFDEDGFIDFVTIPRNNDASYHPENPIRLYKNRGNGNGWITIKLEGVRSNRDAVGAKVWVATGGKTQYKQLISGSSYNSQNSLLLHFGLGKAKKVDRIEILWPSGERQVLENVKVNQRLTLVENEE